MVFSQIYLISSMFSCLSVRSISFYMDGITKPMAGFRDGSWFMIYDLPYRVATCYFMGWPPSRPEFEEVESTKRYEN